MTSSKVPSRDNEAFWRDYLTRGDGMERRVRRVFRLIPQSPRCKLCAAPFGGLGAPVMRAFGKFPATKNPAMCNSCFAYMERHHGGAEIDASFLFADIRGSTSLAERMSAGEFHGLLDRFYVTAAQVVYDHDGGVDKYVGDEIVAFFFPVMSGERHAEQAVKAATAILRATGHEDRGGPWLPVGAGVGSGMAWVGAIGDAQHTDVTAVGDNVNITARLAGAAGTGEVLVTVEAAAAAGLEPSLPVEQLDLKGKQAPTRVVRLSVRPPD